MTVRAFWRATKVETAQSPLDTIHLKIFYPAQMSDDQLSRNMGVVPANSQLAPFPVVIFFNGFNCDAQIYQWLAVELANRGLVVILFNWVAENLPGFIGLTPGVDLSCLSPSSYGKSPSALVLPALLEELEELQNSGILTGMLDLDNIILGGHSAGGRIALENANPNFFPQVKASFAYAAHSAAGTSMGYAAETILPLPDSLPMLIMGGTCDGVIANSAHRYEMSPDATLAIKRTFLEAISGERNDSYLVLLQGANHFSMATPIDSTTGRAFLDFPCTQSETAIHALIAEIIGLFLDAHIRSSRSAYHALEKLFNDDNVLIESCLRK
ncbi:MAG: alpha/beta hydrolase family protein [Pleurocapsa sp.]